MNSVDEEEVGLQLVETEQLSMRDWVEVTGRDPQAFGPTNAALSFRPKSHHVGLRDADGLLLAVVGTTVVTVEVDGFAPFEVVGVGGLIVHPRARGRGLARPVMDRLTAYMTTAGPDRAMLLCEPGLAETYARRGYRVLQCPVSAEQADGRIEIPLTAMWRPLRPVDWPPGPLHIHGLPF